MGNGGRFGSGESSFTLSMGKILTTRQNRAENSADSECQRHTNSAGVPPINALFRITRRPTIS